MPQTCTICRHQDREEIEVSIVRRVPYRTIAERHDISATAVIRHAQTHLPAMLAKAEDAREIACAGSVLDQVEGLRDSAAAILARAEQCQDSETALKAIREARGCVELLAKVAGQLRDGPTINVLVTPEWAVLQSAIMLALSEHPSARVAVAAALRQLESPVIDADAA